MVNVQSKLPIYGNQNLVAGYTRTTPMFFEYFSHQTGNPYLPIFLIHVSSRGWLTNMKNSFSCRRDGSCLGLSQVEIHAVQGPDICVVDVYDFLTAQVVEDCRDFSTGETLSSEEPA